MPFGLVFGALVFGVLCGAIGLRWVIQPEIAGKIGGILLASLGASLALGLVLRRAWARWGGVVIAALLAVVAFRLVGERGAASDHMLLLCALATAVFLAIPATGDPRRGAAGAGRSEASRFGALGWIAGTSALGLAAFGFAANPLVVESPREASGSLPASATVRSVKWLDFEEGLARARAEGKPVLATFVTTWCPYCTKMSRQTWRTGDVAERLQELVPVKVVVDDENAGRGPANQEIAASYEVYGYPVQLLLDGQGGVIARHEGFQDPRALLAWIDGALSRGPAGNTAAALRDPIR